MYGTETNGTHRGIERFVLTTSDGIRYHFGMMPTTPVSPFVQPIEIAHTRSCSGGGTQSSVITSWYLFKIESPNGEKQVTFSYERDRFANYTHSTNLGTLNHYLYQSQNANNCNRIDPVKLFTFGVRLSNITTPLEKVTFLPGNYREDLSRWDAADITDQYTDMGTSSSPTLGSVVMSDKNGNCLKSYHFSYDYLIDNSSIIHPSFSVGNVTVDKKRLRLLAVQEKSCDGTVSTPPYAFQYYTETLPRRLNFARDHWGFNNGAVANMELFPLMTDNSGQTINDKKGLSINNREPSWPAMRAGTIKTITYPTGGYASFDFEPHKVITNNGSGDVESIVGGLRVSKITMLDPLANLPTEINYAYIQSSSNATSGVLFGRPIYVQIVRNEHARLTSQLSSNNNGCYTTDAGNAVTDRYYVISDNSLRPMENTQGSHVGYSRVVEERTGNGKRVLTFDVSLNNSSSSPPIPATIAQVYINNPGPCDLNIPNYPAAPLAFAANRGKLKMETFLDHSGNIISEKEYSYLLSDAGFRVPGYLQFYLGTSVNNFSDFLFTYYELRTSKSYATGINEKVFQPNSSFLQSLTQTFFESNWHNYPTKIVTTNSKGVNEERKITYSADLRTSTMNAVTNCHSSGNNAFLDKYSSLLGQYNFADQSQRNSYLQQFNHALASSRKSFVDCRRINYTNTPNHGGSWSNAAQALNNAINAADEWLQPVLWLQKINRNEIVEESRWHNNKLLSASYTQFINDRMDENGLYPYRQFGVELSSPSGSFASANIPTNNLTISKDSRYIELAKFSFHRANPITLTKRNNETVGYEWTPDNALPIATVTNAKNDVKDRLISGTVSTNYSGSLGSSGGSFSHTISFEQTQAGAISFSLPTPPPGAKVTAYITLNGPSSQNFTLCAGGSGAPTCSGTPAFTTLSNMPAGTYNLSVTASTSFNSYSFVYRVDHSYYGKVLSVAGDKEFYINTFEYDNTAQVVSGNAHTGQKFLNGSFSISPPLASGRQYIAQWWRLVNGVWQFNSSNYTIGQVLAGPVDNVRIIPIDGQVKSYTYASDGKMTSETDHTGNTTYYSYDRFGRLLIVRNNERNIVKQFCYNYFGQQIDCNTTTFVNDQAYSAQFTKNDCGYGTAGPPLTYSIGIGTVESQVSVAHANTLAQQKLQNDGQAFANATGSCTFWNPEAQSGTFTRNNCSPGYTGSTVTYTVPAGTVSSQISIEHANTLAQQQVQNNGQAYANANGTCTQATIYARLEIMNTSTSWYSTYGELQIKLYSDPSCTQPVSVSNLDVSYEMLTTQNGYSPYVYCDGGYMSTVNITGNNYYLGWVTLSDMPDYNLECLYDYTLIPGGGYTIINQ